MFVSEEDRLYWQQRLCFQREWRILRNRFTVVQWLPFFGDQVLFIIFLKRIALVGSYVLFLALTAFTALYILPVNQRSAGRPAVSSCLQ